MISNHDLLLMSPRHISRLLITIIGEHGLADQSEPSILSHDLPSANQKPGLHLSANQRPGLAGDGRKFLQSQADELKDNRYHESSLLSLTSLINLYQEGRRQRKYNFEQTPLYC